MIIHKSHSKTDLIDYINDLGLPIVFSHQDNKRDIHEKYQEVFLKKFDFKPNFYKIENLDGLKIYLENCNPKKTLSIKEKQNVMLICKHIINYCKNGYDLNLCKYESPKELQDDMDFIKQFGDIPSVRRCCKLMNNDYHFVGINFKPYISPQTQKILDEKNANSTKKNLNFGAKIRRATPDNPILVVFD
jgi:predicted phosphoadenosine phosphosulfate sulfurtransferase